VDTKELEATKRFAEEASRRHGYPLRAEAVLQLRTMERAHEARKSGVRALKAAPELVAAHRRGEKLLPQARRLGLPPVAALRALLVELGRSEVEVKAMLARPELLPPALAAEAPELFAADLGSRENARRLQAEAAEFEAEVGEALRGRFPGAGLRSEAELRRRPDERAPGLTPDFLFEHPVELRGRPVGWVDAKNYPLADQPLVLKGLEAQAAKYIKAFGPGAFIFGGGILARSRLRAIPGLLLLGGTDSLGSPQGAAE
jgi:hypothetical protein